METRRQKSELRRSKSVTFAGDATKKTILHKTEDNCLLFAAIDFGTSNTGFAYSFKGSEEKVLTSSFGGVLQTDRVPTTVLLNPDETLSAFGSAAVEKFTALLEDEDDENYFYFENFKMALYNTKQLTRDTEIMDARGRPFNAMRIFAIVIEYIKDITFNIARETKIDLTISDVQWIITVPAIWSDSVKQFMREAAIKADIDPRKLRLILEPEAASVFSREQRAVVCESSFEKLSTGSKYLLADLGGGTVDICVHEVISDTEIRELFRASGNDLGGNSVNKEFEAFMEDIVGEEAWSRFKSECLIAYRDTMNSFERKKKMFLNEKLILKLESALEQIVEEETGKILKRAVEEYSFSSGLEYKHAYKLVVSHTLMAGFFKPSLEELIRQLKYILEVCKSDEISTVFLVGGYAESPYIRQVLKKEFDGLDFVIHQDAGLAVLKGAVMMAHNPKNIIQRRSRFTYGFSKGKLFVDAEHLNGLKDRHGREEWCTYLFDILIKKGQVVKYGDTFIRKGHRTAKDPEVKHKIGFVPLFRSTRDDPKYCVEDTETVLIGGIMMHPPANGWPDTMAFEKHLIVGENEFTVKAINKTTDQEYEAHLEFL